MNPSKNHSSGICKFGKKKLFKMTFGYDYLQIVMYMSGKIKFVAMYNVFCYDFFDFFYTADRIFVFP